MSRRDGQPILRLPKTFKKLSLIDSMRYHLICHRSKSIHVNHLIFLNLSLGVFRVQSSALRVLVLTLLFGAYATYSIVLVGIAVMLMCFCWAVAWHGRRHEYRTADVKRMVRAPPGSVVLFSFSAQLLGHYFFETIHAKPNLFHGFVAAPTLEYVSFLLRHGFMPRLRRGVFGQVARCAARPLVPPY